MVVAVGGVVGKADARVKASVRIVVRPTKVGINFIVAMLGVIIIIQAVLDRWRPDILAEVVVPASHE